jgi:hypothetical protein
LRTSAARGSALAAIGNHFYLPSLLERQAAEGCHKAIKVVTDPVHHELTRKPPDKSMKYGGETAALLRVAYRTSLYGSD